MITRKDVPYEDGEALNPGVIRQPLDGPVFEKLEDARNWCIHAMISHFYRRMGMADATIYPFEGMVNFTPDPPESRLREIERICTASFTVLRLLTPLKMPYEAAKKRAEPYTKIVGELPEMRKEAVVLIKDAIEHNRRSYVLVNNRLEGNAPLTVQALTDVLKND